MEQDEICRLTAVAAQRRIVVGELSVEEYVKCLIARYQGRDTDVNAWAYIDTEHIVREARRLDQVPFERRGPLHGFVVGIKDITNTEEYPTKHNSPIHIDDKPQIDASTVAILRGHGALIMGKTRTTEFAASRAGPGTKNPHNPSRSPGGSSSGSAAAVADMQIPIATGSQTVGSIIRPASFNGIFGFKPTWNAISSEGQKVSSPTLDTFGVLARSIDDLDVLADVFCLGDDQPPPETIPLQGAKFAMVRSPVWSAAGPATIAAMERAGNILLDAGAVVEDVSLPSEFDDLLDMQNRILAAEAGVAFYRDYSTVSEGLSNELVAMANKINTFSRKEYLQAFDKVASLRPKFDQIAQHYTAIVTPSAVDVAPVGIAWTGNSDFNGIWTALHTPIINIPGFQGEEEMPLGLSLVSGRYRDRHLLQVAKAVGPLFLANGGWGGNRDKLIQNALGLFKAE